MNVKKTAGKKALFLPAATDK